MLKSGGQRDLKSSNVPITPSSFLEPPLEEPPYISKIVENT